ncbi:hypothetical protein THASP1DRAFT_30381 [Thamnocephalis sphaerospora]|uniref:NmrA-like domain-containing protein n=1 Tax=Thamnocephalis sphaerospora TaxID=78915 RepID=A0A4P9XP82_9FUNG|nr:hypothetical protein THASP1DRAFT_30381 [Thamnocephalis sphaerospora]|eukprot:RKP07803.1 hypothetical protein THASP1DRAFT_30381 [Thamnocephalis sphaerospora]
MPMTRRWLRVLSRYSPQVQLYKTMFLQTIRVMVAGGTGDVGSEIVRALAADPDYDVAVLSRPNSTATRIKKIQTFDTRIVNADYKKHDELANVLRGIDIVVSAIDYDYLLEPQLALVRAAAEAGVKRFVPSEYWLDTDKVDSPMTEDNRTVKRAIEASGMEHTYYYCGHFYEYLVDKYFGVDVPRRRATVIGSGNALLSMAHTKDVGRFVALTLKDPRSRNASLQFEGGRFTINQIIERLEKITGNKFTVTYCDADGDIDGSEEHADLSALAADFLELVDQGAALMTRADHQQYSGFEFWSFDDYLKHKSAKWVR